MRLHITALVAFLLSAASLAASSSWTAEGTVQAVRITLAEAGESCAFGDGVLVGVERVEIDLLEPSIGSRRVSSFACPAETSCECLAAALPGARVAASGIVRSNELRVQRIESR